MNTMLGGLFQSRLNANIREENGFSYGVSSSFAYGKGRGAFRAGGDVIPAAFLAVASSSSVTGSTSRAASRAGSS